MTLRKFTILTLLIALAGAAVGVGAGAIAGRTSAGDLAIAASWGGFGLVLLAAFLLMGDNSPAVHGMRMDRARTSLQFREPVMLNRGDIDRATAENLSRFQRLAGPGLIFASAGLIVIVASLATNRFV